MSWIRDLFAGHDESSGAVYGVEQATPEQIRQEIDKLAREHLGVSGEEALHKLDGGELRGTWLEVELKMRRFLLGDATPDGSNDKTSDAWDQIKAAAL